MTTDEEKLQARIDRNKPGLTPIGEAVAEVLAAIDPDGSRMRAAEERLAERGPAEEIPEEELVHGQVYELTARATLVGAWNANDRKFIGLRMKFNARYLFGEYHWNADPRHGTARAIRELTGVKIPAHWFNHYMNNLEQDKEDPLFILLNALDQEVVRHNRLESEIAWKVRDLWDSHKAEGSE